MTREDEEDSSRPHKKLKVDHDSFNEAVQGIEKQITALKLVPVVALDDAKDAIPLAHALLVILRSCRAAK